MTTTNTTPRRRTWVPAITMAALILFTGNLTALAQQSGQQEHLPELNRWNVQISTGTYMGAVGRGLTPYSGSLNSTSRYFNPTFAVDVEYMVSLNVGLKASYVHSNIENRSGAASFRNEYQMFNLGVNFYLFKLFDVTFLTESLNPYVTMRTGYSRSSLSNLSNRSDRSGFHGHYGLGAGTRYRINDRIDASATYYYTFYNPAIRLDGQSRSGLYETQRLAGFKVGISIKLGSSDRQSARWFRRTRQASQNLIFI